jgi:hypothetical protein
MGTMANPRYQGILLLALQVVVLYVNVAHSRPNKPGLRSNGLLAGKCW